jgi:membrane protein DedA with SNARE-associated domain
MNFLATHFNASFLAISAIVLGAFFSEDAATIAAASFAAARVLDTRLSFLSAFAGLWVGDLGVYAVARWGSEKAQTWGWVQRSGISREGKSAAVAGDWPLALSRFFPGTRLPAYVSAGLQRTPFLRYAAITAATAASWTFLVFLGVFSFPGQAETIREKLVKLGFAGLLVFAVLFLWRAKGQRITARLAFARQRIIRWEFWPAWLFYAPVAGICAWLGLRYRGFSLPTIANLNQKNGGLIGESKIEILRELMRTSPDVTAQAFSIPAGKLEDRLAQIASILRTHSISFPFVLKPDTAQRGAGFRKVSSTEEARNYLQIVAQPLVLQRYVEGPSEAGIFYYRIPGEACGHIFGITRKRFPVVTGDGQHSLEQLIARDDRARFLYKVYLKRLGEAAGRVPKAGETVRLVEAGNHCQGCIFEDGRDLDSEELRLAMDAISRKIPGFCVGRFDVRYTSDDALRAGQGFQVIELNGAASEATNLYDAKNTLWSAYRTLYQQWRLIYAIGAENRKRGALPRSVLALWRDWRDFSATVCEFPIAD